MIKYNYRGEELPLSYAGYGSSPAGKKTMAYRLVEEVEYILERSVHSGIIRCRYQFGGSASEGVTANNWQEAFSGAESAPISTSEAESPFSSFPPSEFKLERPMYKEMAERLDLTSQSIESRANTCRKEVLRISLQKKGEVLNLFILFETILKQDNSYGYMRFDEFIKRVLEYFNLQTSPDLSQLFLPYVYLLIDSFPNIQTDKLVIKSIRDKTARIDTIRIANINYNHIIQTNKKIYNFFRENSLGNLLPLAKFQNFVTNRIRKPMDYVKHLIHVFDFFQIKSGFLKLKYPDNSHHIIFFINEIFLTLNRPLKLNEIINHLKTMFDLSIKKSSVCTAITNAPHYHKINFGVYELKA